MSLVESSRRSVEAIVRKVKCEIEIRLGWKRRVLGSERQVDCFRERVVRSNVLFFVRRR